MSAAATTFAGVSERPEEPVARPLIAPSAYGFPTSDAQLLPWAYAEQRLVAARNYWLATTRPDGRPHVSPAWGSGWRVGCISTACQ